MNYFNNLKQHLTKDKVAVFNHLIDNTFDIPALRVYSLNRNNKEIKNTRKAGQGAHFRVTCWRQPGSSEAHEAYIYWTRSYSIYKDHNCSTISVTAVNKLPFNCKVVFENGCRFSKPLSLDFIKKYKMVEIRGSLQYAIPMKDITWIDPDFNKRSECYYSIRRQVCQPV